MGDLSRAYCLAPGHDPHLEGKYHRRDLERDHHRRSLEGDYHRHGLDRVVQAAAQTA